VQNRAKKPAANVRVIDYEANLALLEPAEKSFLDGITPLEITSDTVVGDRLAAWQLGTDRARSLATEGLVTTVQMMPYPVDLGNSSRYRVSIPDAVSREQLHGASWSRTTSSPGLLLRYDSRSQLLDAIPAPIITHFFKDAEGQNYRGFPSAASHFFRRAIRRCASSRAKRASAGVYITNVEAGYACEIRQE
jgi:hypothetical protein